MQLFRVSVRTVVSLLPLLLALILPSTSIAYTSLTSFEPVGAPQFFLRNVNSEGMPSSILAYGEWGDIGIAGDWDGDGDDTIGIYRPSNATFHLRNSNWAGPADEIISRAAMIGDIPVVGDWDGDGDDTVGVYRPSTREFFLRNVNTAASADYVMSYGNPGDIPIVGDWDGDGDDTIGVYRPQESRFYLRNTNSAGFADINVNYGVPGDKPVIGDWNGDGIDSIGIFRPGPTNWFLRNSNTPGGSADVIFGFGSVGSPNPIVGNWDGVGGSNIGLYLNPRPDRWSNLQITYGFVNGTSDIAGEGEQAAVREAMALWAGITPLTFHEVPPAEADIKIGWKMPWDGSEWPFMGAGNLDYAHSLFPLDGDIYFNDGETWTTGTRANSSPPIDLVTVAAHALGHVIGLDDIPESDVTMNTMFRSYTGTRRSVWLDQFGSEGTEALYGPHPEARRYFLRNANSFGRADVVFPGEGAPGYYRGGKLVSGDWNGDGVDTIGVYYPDAGGFSLWDRNSADYRDTRLSFGADWRDRPLAGDWNGDGVDTVGLYRPSEGKFYLATSNSSQASFIMFRYANAEDLPIAGDWNGDGIDSVGVYRPSNGVFYLTNRNATVPPDYTFPYGNTGDLPVAGDWNEQGRDYIGLYRPGTGVWYLEENSLSTNPPDAVFPFGTVSAIVPAVGDWNGSGTDTPGFALDP
jgi:matrixin